MTLAQITTLLARVHQAYDKHRLCAMRARLCSLPSACEHAREAAHQRYVRTLRHIDMVEQVERLQLEHDIKDMEVRA